MLLAVPAIVFFAFSMSLATPADATAALIAWRMFFFVFNEVFGSQRVRTTNNPRMISRNSSIAMAPIRFSSLALVTVRT